MSFVLLTSFGPIRKGDWVVKVSHALDQVVVVAYHKTTYEGHVRCFLNELEAVMYVEYLLMKGDYPTDFTE